MVSHLASSGGWARGGSGLEVRGQHSQVFRERGVHRDGLHSVVRFLEGFRLSSEGVCERWSFFMERAQSVICLIVRCTVA